MTEKPILASIQVGLPKQLGTPGAIDPMDRPWVTAAFKEAVEGPVWLGKTNLAGDGQANLEVHGGPDKAVLAYAAEHYPVWRSELRLPNLSNGGFAENFTVDGLAEQTVAIGDIFQVGDARVQVSEPRQPCWKNSRRWRIKDLSLRIQNSGRTGWYFRVLQEGNVESGIPLVLLDRPFPEWTVALANDIMHGRFDDKGLAAKLSECRLLGASWKNHLSALAKGQKPANTQRRLWGQSSTND
ncbi:MAG: MOSC domain-containing protein [Deltaproteobacteria bacterium]|nr:MOSC domain-containing protein [Deltaproteobacteria bacterium]